MRPAKVREQASCPLQFFELGHFRTVIKGQSLPQAWWHLAQTRNKRLARGGGRLLWALASSRKRPLRLLQLSSAALPLEAQTRFDSLPKAIPLGSRLRSLADVSTPGKQAAAPGSYPLCRLLRRSPMSATQLAAYGLHADMHAFILRPVQAHTACNLFGRAVAARLLIYPGNLFGLAHAAEMARHCSSFPGTVISSPGTIAGFGAVAVHSRDQGHGHRYFDPDAFFQGKMAVGHGGLLLAAWLLLLPIPPESSSGLLPLHAPTMWVRVVRLE